MCIYINKKNIMGIAFIVGIVSVGNLVDSWMKNGPLFITTVIFII